MKLRDNSIIDAGLGHVVTGDVQVRRNDRDINNVAHNPFSDSWEQGWVGVGEAAFGFANLIGEETGFDGLASWGEDGVIRQQSKLAEYGTTTLDYKDVDGFYSAIEYLGNNLALSIPYMAGTIGATAVGCTRCSWDSCYCWRSRCWRCRLVPLVPLVL